MYLPDAMLPDCIGPVWSGGDFEAVGILAEQRRTVILDCQAAIVRARQYQADLRAGEKPSSR